MDGEVSRNAARRLSCLLQSGFGGGRELLGQLNVMENDAPSSMEVPSEARGRFVRMTITRQSGLLHNLLVYAEAAPG